MKFEAKKNRIFYLSHMVSKYAHRYNENPSRRMIKWVDELDDLISDLRHNHTKEWKELCKSEGWDPTVNAYDCLA